MPVDGPWPTSALRLFARPLALLLAVACLCAACAKVNPPPLAPNSKEQATDQPHRRAALGYGDEVAVAVWRNEDLKHTVRVDEAGRISLPLVGEVQAGGRTASELRAELAARYAKYLVDPQVTVNVATLKSQTALVMGEVKTQGAVVVDHDINLFEAIARSGGFTENAGRSGVFLLRMEGERPRVYVLDMRLGNNIGKGAHGFNRYVQGGDILFVPKSLIASVEEFMGHMTAILSSLVNAERFVIFMPQLRDAVNDLFKGPQSTTVINQSQPVAGEVLSNSQGGVISVQ